MKFLIDKIGYADEKFFPRNFVSCINDFAFTFKISSWLTLLQSYQVWITLQVLVIVIMHVTMGT